jgi:hypothetical protein
MGAIATATMLLAAPSAASAVTGAISAPCYTHIPTVGSAPVVVNLAGGTPGAGFIVAATGPTGGVGSAGSATGTFDPAGNGSAAITDVSPPSGSIDPIAGEPIVLSVKDFGTGAAAVDVPIGQTLVTNLAMTIALKPRSIRAHRTVKVSGTPFAGLAMYGFITKGTNPKVLRRVSLGTGDGCGYTSAKVIVAPKSFKPGTYRLYVNPGTKLDKPKSIFRSFKISRSLF